MRKSAISSILFVCIILFFASPQISFAKKKIELLAADILTFDESLGKNAKRLLGNVAFKHGEAIMHCDSAHLLTKTNILIAYGNVHITKGSSLDIYGDEVYYDGNTKLADIKRNVKMIDKDVTLFTEYMIYNMDLDIGKYTNHGRIIDGESVLVSKQGNYNSTYKTLNFKDSVKITNPSYTITCDTLHYNINTDVANFLGPTEIVEKSSYIYCERGWHNSKNNTALFTKNAFIESDGQRVEGDSLFYDQDKNEGIAKHNVAIIDTANNTTVVGNYARFKNNGTDAIVSDHSVLIQIHNTDTMYTYGDTLKIRYDSISDSQDFFAYYHVKLFRPDMQGKCDSMAYSESDSTIRMFNNPILWFDDYQLTASHITIETYDSEVKSFHLDQNAFIASIDDSINYNQIKGDTMLGYFNNNKLQKIHVIGTGESIFFIRDDNEEKELIGVNQATSKEMWIHVLDNEINRINYVSSPVATMYPPEDFKEEEEPFLSNFKWRGSERPLSKKDIFIQE
ncbi:MAG: hypothetical protein HRT72_10605 [Flavobacteriales bacterium]|nr:hypothetical protein [Flavobacteriales bacterium]